MRGRCPWYCHSYVVYTGEKKVAGVKVLQYMDVLLLVSITGFRLYQTNNACKCGQLCTNAYP